MAQKKKDAQVARAIGHGIAGGFPVAAQYESYKAGRTAGLGKGGSVGLAAASVPAYVATGGLSGVAAGAYHGYNKKPARSLQNRKAGGTGSVGKKKYH